MRELTVRIKFTKPCLGNVKARDGSQRFLLPRNQQGYVTFLHTWHQSNMRFAAQVLGKHQDEVGKIVWDIQVDGHTKKDHWERRYYAAGGGRTRYSLHEAFVEGQVVSINCVVPASVSDEDFWRLMQLAGRYKGISPFKPGQFGHFNVESIRPRRAVRPDLGVNVEDTEEELESQRPDQLPAGRASGEAV